MNVEEKSQKIKSVKVKFVWESLIVTFYVGLPRWDWIQDRH